LGYHEGVVGWEATVERGSKGQFRKVEENVVDFT
jgi:hypothetical protein